MPKQINTHLPGQALVRLFGLKGRYQPVLDETIVPVVVVGEQKAEEVKLAEAAHNTGNVAAEYTFASLLNPAGSKILVRLTEVGAVPYTGSYVGMTSLHYTYTAGAIGLMLPEWRQAWLAGAPAALAQRGTNTTSLTVMGGATWLHYASSTVPLRKTVRFEIRPGQALLMQVDTVNVGCRWSIEWEEEPLNVTDI